MRLRRALTAGSLIAALAASGAGAAIAVARPSVSVYGTTPAARAAAGLAATQLLADLQLPSDGDSTGVPTSVRSELSRPGLDEVTTNLADSSSLRTVHASPASILRYVSARLPRGAGSPGTQSGPGLQERSWTLAPIAGISQRILSVEVVALRGGATAVRLDGEAVWLTPRPEWEKIGPGVRSATLTGHLQTASGEVRQLAPRRLSARDAQALAATINGFEVSQPGVESCPAARDSEITLGFDGADGRRLATAVESPTGCASVSLTVFGRRGPTLADGQPAGRTVTDVLARLQILADSGLRAPARHRGEDLTALIR